MTKAKKKTQTELAGIEKPSIPELDDLCAAHLKLSKAVRKATDKATAAKVAVKEFMVKHRTKFNEDADKNRVYGYQDGDGEKIFKLRKGEDLVVTNAKRLKLEVVAEPKGDIG